VSRGRLFGSLCGMVFLVNFARIVFAPLLSEFIEVFQVGEATVGIVTTLVWVGSALTRLPTGWLLTRYPRHRLVLWTGVLLSGAGLFTATADSIVMLGAGAATMGMASGVYFVAANPLVSELFPARVGRMMGIHGTASQVAAVGAAPLVAVVTTVLGLEWRAVFVVIGVASLLVTIALYATARRAELPTAGESDRRLLVAARAQWRVIAVGIAILGATGFVWQGLFNFYELYLVAKGLDPSTARTGLTLAFAAGIPAFFFSGRIVDRVPRVPYVLGVVAAFAVTVLALTVAEGVVALAALSLLVGYAIHSLFPALDTYLLAVMPDEHRGSAYAVYSFLMMTIQAMGASVVGRLVESGLAYDRVFGALAGVLLVVVVGVGLLHRRGLVPT